MVACYGDYGNVMPFGPDRVSLLTGPAADAAIARHPARLKEPSPSETEPPPELRPEVESENSPVINREMEKLQHEIENETELPPNPWRDTPQGRRVYVETTENGESATKAGTFVASPGGEEFGQLFVQVDGIHGPGKFGKYGAQTVILDPSGEVRDLATDESPEPALLSAL